MGLLNPILLMLGAAAAVPLLLHLLQRHQGPRVSFPALRYLRRAEKESARRIRVRQLLLMLLRVAAVLLVALAAARPFLPLGGRGHSPTAVVIVLDNSMSTAVVEGEQRVLDRLKERALETLGAAGPDDRFWLLRAGNPGEPALPGDAMTTARRVRETVPSAAAADVPAALVHASAILAAGADSRAPEIHLLTDLQASGLAARATEPGAAPVVVWHPGTEPPANSGVTAVEAGGGLAPIAGLRSTVAATVAGTTDSINVRLHLDDRLVAAATARPGTSVVLALPARGAGLLAGRVEIDADALRADDVRFFTSRVMPPPSVSLAAPLAFADDALDVLAAGGRIRRVPSAGDVALLPAAVNLRSQPPQTAVVVTAPDAVEEIAAVNRRLADAGVPWRYGPPAQGEARFERSADPLMNALANVRVRLAYPLESTGAAGTESVLLRLDDGGAWAVRGTRRGGGIYVLLGSPLSVEATTLPTSAAMVPLLDRITSAWALSQPAGTEIAPGGTTTLPAGATAVLRPDGTRDGVDAGEYRVGGAPGAYMILAGDSVLGGFAVNAPAAESDLRRLDGAALADVLPAWDVHVTDDAGEFQREVYRERLGSELWRTLLFAALAVLLVETIIAAAGRRRASAAAPQLAEADSH